MRGDNGTTEIGLTGEKGIFIIKLFLYQENTLGNTITVINLFICL